MPIENEDWWPDLVAVVNDHSLLQLCKRFGTDPVELVAALKRAGVERSAQAGRTANRPRLRHESRLEPFADIVGTMSDAAVAKRAGVSTGAVLHFRRVRKIPAYEPPVPAVKEAPKPAAKEAPKPAAKAAPKPAAKEAPKPAAKAAPKPAAKPAAKTVPKGRVLKRRADAPDVVEEVTPPAPVEEPEPAPEAAPAPAKKAAAPKKSAVPKKAAETKSQKKAKSVKTTKKAKAKPGRKSVIDAYADLVGTVADRVVAEKAGVTIGAVRAWRVRRGIPAMSKRGALPPEPGEASAPSRPRRWSRSRPPRGTGSAADPDGAKSACWSDAERARIRACDATPGSATVTGGSGTAPDTVAPRFPPTPSPD